MRLKSRVRHDTFVSSWICTLKHEDTEAYISSNTIPNLKFNLVDL